MPNLGYIVSAAVAFHSAFLVRCPQHRRKKWPNFAKARQVVLQQIAYIYRIRSTAFAVCENSPQYQQTLATNR
jgi:hypothetical protein